MASMSYSRDKEGIIYPNIKRAIDGRGITYAEISEDLSMSEHTIRRYLTGAAYPTKAFIDKILALTGMTYEKAFAESEERR